MAIVGQLQKQFFDFSKSLYREVSFFLPFLFPLIFERRRRSAILGDSLIMNSLQSIFFSHEKNWCFGRVAKRVFKFCLILKHFIFVSLCFSFFFFLFSDWLMVVEKRGSWMISLCSYRSCKMRATQILYSKWWPFSLRILRSFSIIWPLLCEFNFFVFWGSFMAFDSNNLLMSLWIM